MNGLREFFGNIPMFQKQVEREIEAKGIQPTQGVKNVEYGRQVFKKWIGLLIGVVVVVFVGLTYFNNKNQPSGTTPATTTSNETNSTEAANTTNTTESSSQAVQGNSDHLLKLSAQERADEATEAFESWYQSFSNGDVILEINQELLKEGSGGTSPIELQTKLIDNLKAKFGDNVSDDFYTGLQASFNFNPVIVDSTKGLTISKQNEDKSQWLRTWFLDTSKTEANTQILLRNDFSSEYFDWRNDSESSDKTKNLLTEIDWANDLSYETVGISLMHSTKNIDSPEIIFIVMRYNEEIGKWQVTGSIGGITQ